MHAALDEAALEAALRPHPVLRVRSAAPDRGAYLRRPDLGRRLDPGSSGLPTPGGFDVVFVLADGLSVNEATRPVFRRGWWMCCVGLEQGASGRHYGRHQ